MPQYSKSILEYMLKKYQVVISFFDFPTAQSKESIHDLDQGMQHLVKVDNKALHTGV